MRRLSLVGTVAAVTALLLALPAHAEAPTRSDVKILGTSTVVGTSQLDREKSGISFSLKTSGLVRGSANTIWVVIFDNPLACGIDGCNALDLPNPDVNGRAVWGAGTVSDNGTSAFDGHIPAGAYDADLLARGGGGAGTVFMNPLTAEVHLVVRTHGQALQGMVADQIHSFGLGCNPTCANIQFAPYVVPIAP